MEYKTGGGVMNNRSAGNAGGKGKVHTGNTQILRGGDGTKQGGKVKFTNPSQPAPGSDKKVLRTLLYAIACLVLVIIAMVIKVKYFSIAISVVLAFGIYVVFDAFMNEKEKKRHQNYMGCVAATLMIAGSIGLYLAKVLPVMFNLWQD